MASPSAQAKGLSAEKFNEPETPCGLLREKSTEIRLTSAGTPDTKQCTPHSDIKQVTPRSILKTSKFPTPKQEMKRVSFLEKDESDGMASSASSIVLEVISPQNIKYMLIPDKLC